MCTCAGFVCAASDSGSESLGLGLTVALSFANWNQSEAPRGMASVTSLVTLCFFSSRCTASSWNVNSSSANLCVCVCVCVCVLLEGGVEGRRE